MNIFLKFISDNPHAYQYIACNLAALTAFVTVYLSTRRCRQLLDLLLGPVPALSDPKSLRSFDDKRQFLRDRADGAGFLAGISAVACLIVGVWIYNREDTISPFIISAGIVLACSLLHFFLGVLKYDSKIEDALAHRPELSGLKYIKYIPDSTPVSEEKLFAGSLDDFVCVFQINDARANNSNAAPLPVEDSRIFSDAQWSAVNNQRPQKGDDVLLLWRDGKGKTARVMVTKVTAVEDAPTESLMSRPGRTIVTAAGEKFCGGKLAYFVGGANQKIERGWLATADCAHILLASLCWLDNDQRELCFQLINPGKSFMARQA